MNARTILKNAVLVGLLLAGSSSMAASGSSSQSIGIYGQVPVICRVTLSGGTTEVRAVGQPIVGSISEFCNSGSGYQVLARADNVGEGAHLVIDGARIPLQSGNEIVMVRSSTPNIQNRDIVFDAGATDTGARLSVRIVAN